MITEAHTSIKNAVRYYGEGMHLGAQIPLNLVLLDDVDKDSDARDIKFATDKWMTYKPMKGPANWVVSKLLLKCSREIVMYESDYTWSTLMDPVCTTPLSL